MEAKLEDHCKSGNRNPNESFRLALILLDTVPSYAQKEGQTKIIPRFRLLLGSNKRIMLYLLFMFMLFIFCQKNTSF